MKVVSLSSCWWDDAPCDVLSRWGILACWCSPWVTFFCVYDAIDCCSPSVVLFVSLWLRVLADSYCNLFDSCTVPKCSWNPFLDLDYFGASLLIDSLSSFLLATLCLPWLVSPRFFRDFALRRSSGLLVPLDMTLMFVLMTAALPSFLLDVPCLCYPGGFLMGCVCSWALCALIYPSVVVKSCNDDLINRVWTRSWLQKSSFICGWCSSHRYHCV